MKFHVSFFNLGSEGGNLLLNWSDNDSLHLVERERRICPSFTVGRLTDNLVNASAAMIKSCAAKWNVSSQRWFVQSFVRSFNLSWLRTVPVSIVVWDDDKMMMMMKKEDVPSQQLPSFMFLSWSWVLWKIFLYILHKYVIIDATCSSQCCVYFWAEMKKVFSHRFLSWFNI